MKALALHTGAPTVHWEYNTSCISVVEAKKVTRSPVVTLTLSANHPVHPCAPVKSSAHAYTQNCARIHSKQRTITPNFSDQ